MATPTITPTARTATAVPLDITPGPGWNARVHAADVSTVGGVDALAADLATGALYAKSINNAYGTNVQLARVSPGGSVSVVATYPAMSNSNLSGIALDPLAPTRGIIVADMAGASRGRIVLVNSLDLTVSTLFDVSWVMNPAYNGTGQQQYASDPSNPNILYFWDSTLAKLLRLDRTTNALVELLALDQAASPGQHMSTALNDLVSDAASGTLLLTDGSANRVLEVDPNASPVTVTTLYSGLPGRPAGIALSSAANEVFVVVGGSIFVGPRSGGSLSLVAVGFGTPDIAVSRASTGVGQSLFAADSVRDRIYEITRSTVAATATETPTPIATAASTPTRMPTATSTETPTAIPTGTSTATATPTTTPTMTATLAPTATPTTVPAVPTMPLGRGSFGAALGSNGKVYAIGGWGGAGSPWSAVHEYDPTGNTWASRAALPSPRYDLGVVAARNGRIYAIGGRNNSTGNPALSTVEEFDPTANGGAGIWAARAGLSMPRSQMGVAAGSNGKIYAIGGRDAAGNPLGSVEEFDPSANGGYGVWRTLSRGLNTPRRALGAAVGPNGKIYAMGGVAGGYLASVEEFDPADEAAGWTAKTGGLSVARAYPGVVAAGNGKVYALAGYRGSGLGDAATVDVYDPATNSWSTLPDLAYQRELFAAAAVPVPGAWKILVMGGSGFNPTLGQLLSDRNVEQILLPFESNDAFDSAALIEPGVSVQDAIDTPGDADYYTFHVGTSGTLDATLSDLPADYDLALYGPNQSLLVRSTNPGTADESLRQEVATAGRHYLRVHGAAGASGVGPYSLRVSLAAPTPTPAPTGTPTPSATSPATGTRTPTASATPTVTSMPTATPTFTATATSTPTATPIDTPTITPTARPTSAMPPDISPAPGWDARVHVAYVSIIGSVDALAADLAAGSLYAKSINNSSGSEIQLARVSPGGSVSVLATYPGMWNSNLSGIALDPLTPGGGIIIADARGDSHGRIALINLSNLTVSTLFDVPWVMNPDYNGTGQQQYAPDSSNPSILYFWDSTLAKLFRLDRTTNALVVLLALDQAASPGRHVSTAFNDLVFDAASRTLLLTDGSANRVLEVDPNTSPATVTTLYSGLPGRPVGIAVSSAANGVFVAVGGSVFVGLRSGGSLSLVAGGFAGTPDVAVGRASTGIGQSLFAADSVRDRIYEITRSTVVATETPTPTATIAGTPTLMPTATSTEMPAGTPTIALTEMATTTAAATGTPTATITPTGTGTPPPTPTGTPAATATATPPARGYVVAWGSNYYGQLGDGTLEDRWTPVQVPGLSGVVAVSAGHYHSLALREDGTVWAWGRNEWGQLGDGTIVDRAEPVQVQNLPRITALVAGLYHSLALDYDGLVWSWGNNWYGQLGDGTTTSRTIPVRVSHLGPWFLSVAAGADHSLALGWDGTVWAWGANHYGQLGNGAPLGGMTSIYEKSPVLVQNLSGVTSIAAGANHSLALKAVDGTVWAWGRNDSVQLGETTFTNRSLPGRVLPIAYVRAIASKGDHSLAMVSTGDIYGWGSNRHGQIGDGTVSSFSRIPAVASMVGAEAIAAGSDHSVALKPDGSVWAWGWNHYGQLGNGTNTDRAWPVQVPGISGALAIAAGLEHTLAVVEDSLPAPTPTPTPTVTATPTATAVPIPQQRIPLHTGWNWLSFALVPSGALVNPVPTNRFANYYGTVNLDGAPVPDGVVVEIYSPRGDLVGSAATVSGWYRYTRVYGEDPGASPPIPGMRDGEAVTFKVGSIVVATGPSAVAWRHDPAPARVDLAIALPVESVLASLEGKYDFVLGERDSYAPPPAPTELNTLRTLEPGKMYFLRMKQAGELVLSGRPLPEDTPIPLGPGWRWIGYLPAAGRDLPAALGSIEGKYDYLLGEDGTYAPPPAPELFNTLSRMEPGRGYLLRMFADATLVYPGPSIESVVWYGEGEGR